MLVFVLNQYGKPLMPCKPQKAKKLLRQDRAKVIRREPFTIQLLYGSSGYRQRVTAGMDSGSKVLGSAATANGKVLYQAEVQLRQDISKKMEQRRMYRRNRRGRKTRYRKARWLNRASMSRQGRLAPSVQSKLDSHFREKRFIESILPVSSWRVETAAFDIHKIVHPEVARADYQQGPQKDFNNVKAYVLHRDGYRCGSQQKVKHSEKLHVHHIMFRSRGGGDQPSNLVTLCEDCHTALHAGQFEIKKAPKPTKHATEIGIISAFLPRADWIFTETFGYLTKFHREQVLQWPKSHYADAAAICCSDGELVQASSVVYRKRHIAKGDFQQTKGARSEKRIPTGKLFGLRKFDYIQTVKGRGFVKGKRSTGFFALMDIAGKVTHASVNVKRECLRLSARSRTLTQRGIQPC